MIDGKKKKIKRNENFDGPADIFIFWEKQVKKWLVIVFGAQLLTKKIPIDSTKFYYFNNETFRSRVDIFTSHVNCVY